jgi:hypothetical protein
MDSEPNDELDGPRVLYGCLLLLWVLTALPLWLLRIAWIGGGLATLQFVVTSALNGNLIEIYLLLSLLMPLALLFLVVHERRHRKSSAQKRDLRSTFE